MTVRLKGIGWDHVRCMGPLHASIDDYRAIAPDVAIEWDTRSLSHFGDGPLEELLDYDLIVFDHPYCGRIAREGWLVDLAQVLDTTVLDAFTRDSLGRCWESYHADGGVWGLPIDAAAQVGSYRPDLMARLDRRPPRTFEEVLDLAGVARGQGLYVGFPAYPIDAICTFLTLCANAGFAVSQNRSFFPERTDVVSVLDAMRTLYECAHPLSGDWNPIRAYDHMSSADDLCYIPYAFSYSNYARPERSKPIRFCNIPGLYGDDCGGALLGGAGIGVSRRSTHPQAALDYARLLCEPNYQAGPYFRDGGQPASLSAWTREENNAACQDFFKDTLETMQKAYLRPTFDGYVAHFRRAGTRIRDFLRGDSTSAALADWIRQDYFG